MKHPLISRRDQLPQQFGREGVYHMNPRISPLVSQPASTGFALRGFSGVSVCWPLRGASRRAHKAERAHQKGTDFGIRHALSFVPVQRVTQQVIPLHFSSEAPVKQMELALLGRLDAPSIVPPNAVGMCKTYRDAVRLCWQLRRVKSMTQAQLAEQAGLYAPHVSCYLHEWKRSRDLPGHAVKGFECACGNTAISQWHAAQAQLTVVEEMQLLRSAA